jgi:hypothetical protein
VKEVTIPICAQFTQHFLAIYRVTGNMQNTEDMKLAKTQSSKGNIHKESQCYMCTNRNISKRMIKSAGGFT